MKNDTGYLQGYNAQTVVDAESQIIVAEALTNQAPDQQHLEPMFDRAIANCGAAPDLLSADSGYFSEHNLLKLFRAARSGKSITYAAPAAAPS